MFEIIRRYNMKYAWYAQILLPDKQRIEFKIRSKTRPSSEAFMTLAQEYWQAQQEALQPSVEIEAEDGHIV